MNKVCGTFLGAGTSEQYIGLGFLPDEVRITSIGASTMDQIIWNRNMIRMSTMAEGIQTATSTRSALTDGNGIELYHGGDIVTAASANQVVAVSHPALVKTYGADQRYATDGVVITKWTKDTTVQGHFDQVANTTYVGIGSKMICEMNSGGPLREYAIVAFSSNGEAANETDLNNEPPDADMKIRFLSYMYDFAPLPAGYVMPFGIRINETTLFNASGIECVIEATKW